MSKSILADISPEILKSMGVDPTHVQAEVGPPKKPDITRKRRNKQGVFATFGEQLASDTAWIKERLQQDKKFLTSLITVRLKEWLHFHGHTFVMKSFLYRKSEMDMMSMYDDYLTEYEIKTCRENYSNDFKKIVFMGKPCNKHAIIRSGQWIANRFYFVCQEGLIDLDHLPEYAGLITFSEHTQKFTIIRHAPWIHKQRVPPGFYKTLSKKLYDRYMSMIQPGRSTQPLNTSYGFDNEENNPQHHPADQGNVNTEG